MTRGWGRRKPRHGARGGHRQQGKATPSKSAAQRRAEAERAAERLQDKRSWGSYV